MRYKLEKLGCYMLIIILLPYVLTVFLNGPIVTSSTNVGEMTVNVSGKNGSETIAMEDYGIGILAREVPGDFEMEALKAQAILVRTRLYKELQENGSETVFSEDFWTKQDMQEAWGIAKFTGYYSNLESAWKNTEGKILLYEEKPVHAPFFSLSNGSTRDGKEVLGKDFSYLKIKDCPMDIESAEQIQTVVLDEINEGETKIEVLSCDTAGYVLKVRVGEEEVNGEEFRQNYNLASSCFSIQEYEGQIRITTRGVGHGIGLSQYTANRMAEEGKNCDEILLYFYEGCEISEVVDFVRNI